MNTAEQVVDILKNEGHYRELPRPFKIGTLSFEFTSALIATEKANDLVIVIDLKSDVPDEGAVRKVHALTRALDVVQSRRSVTAVLTQGQASSETVYAMSRVCRVLPIGTPVGQNASDLVRDWISVLLPLKTPESVETMVHWEEDVRKLLSKDTPADLTHDVFARALTDKGAVEAVLRDQIATSISTAIAEEGNAP